MAQKIEKFEDLIVWQEAKGLATRIYGELKECRYYGFRDQLQRASVSIASNIAEGFERRSNKEFIQHLYIAKGSCSELRTQLYIAQEIGLIEPSKAELLVKSTRSISAMLFGLIKRRSEYF